MRLRLEGLQRACLAAPIHRLHCTPRRHLMTLAIETSCDDTSVAIVEKTNSNKGVKASVHFHKKVTSNNSAFQGVHPLVSLVSHQENLANLVSEAVANLPNDETTTLKRIPDFVSVTRGPGMRANLFTGIDTAKGLAVAWQKPLVGVHHMQAHALTPRLVSALDQKHIIPTEPAFPFVSVLASGGHTLLIQSASLTEHHVLGSTSDIAVGECLDKIARVVLPPNLLQTTKSTMYGALLEDFAWSKANETATSAASDPTSSNDLSDNSGLSTRQYLERSKHKYSWYEVPSNHEKAAQSSTTSWGWALNQPLTKAGGGAKIKNIEFSFSGLLTAVERNVRYGRDPSTKKLNKVERAANDVSLAERQDMARESMRVAFEHMAHRVTLGIQSISATSAPPNAVVVAGGVAANSFLRHIFASTLYARGYPDIKLYFPPPKYCTDNAAMIAWAGLEMFEAGYTDPPSIRAIRKWPLDRLLNPPEDGKV